ncbi:MAG: DUF4159 domain-containing protein [Chitinophagales bacterium]|nr:DUF4159 domain-containing protein [Chitinophagales bacterium]
MKKIIPLFFVFLSLQLSSSAPTLKIALMKYRGGGDWYANPTALPNLIKFCNQNINTNITPEPETVEAGSPDLFNYPFIHMTGHGNVIFNDQEAENLRNYLVGGGFLHISDNYGMDVYVRKAIKKIFPELELVELPFQHPVYHQKFNFSNGLPKIHEHDKKPAQGFGILYEGRLVVFYDYECDLGDGWENPEVHKDPEEKRQQALQMGANLLQFAFTN